MTVIDTEVGAADASGSQVICWNDISCGCLLDQTPNANTRGHQTAK